MLNHFIWIKLAKPNFNDHTQQKNETSQNKSKKKLLGNPTETIATRNNNNPWEELIFSKLAQVFYIKCPIVNQKRLDVPKNMTYAQEIA